MKTVSKWYGHEWSKELTECIKHFSGCTSIRQLKMNVLYIQNPMFKVWVKMGCFIKDGGEFVAVGERDYHIKKEEMILLNEYLYGN